MAIKDILKEIIGLLDMLVEQLFSEENDNNGNDDNGNDDNNGNDDDNGNDDNDKDKDLIDPLDEQSITETIIVNEQIIVAAGESFGPSSGLVHYVAGEEYPDSLELLIFEGGSKIKNIAWTGGKGARVVGEGKVEMENVHGNPLNQSSPFRRWIRVNEGLEIEIEGFSLRNFNGATGINTFGDTRVYARDGWVENGSRFISDNWKVGGEEVDTDSNYVELRNMHVEDVEEFIKANQRGDSGKLCDICIKDVDVLVRANRGADDDDFELKNVIIVE